MNDTKKRNQVEQMKTANINAVMNSVYISSIEVKNREKSKKDEKNLRTRSAFSPRYFTNSFYNYG